MVRYCYIDQRLRVVGSMATFDFRQTVHTSWSKNEIFSTFKVLKTSLQNWFGDVATTDNIQYVLKKPNYKLAANTPLRIRFFVVYNPNESPPQLTMFRLNAKTLCPVNEATTEAFVMTGQPLTSSILSTTSIPLSNPGSM